MSQMGDDCYFFYFQTCVKKNTPCYFESQPGGCTKPNCAFQHKFPPQQSVPASTVPSAGPGPLPVSSHVPGVWTVPSTQSQLPPRPVWPGPHIPPPHMFPGLPLGGPPRTGVPIFPPYRPGGPPMHNPLVRPPVHMIPIEPVIINPNDESDQDSLKGSPMKPIGGGAKVPSQLPARSDNPLDYFLNAKPWVDPNLRTVVNRSPSPRRLSPYRKQGSVSPRRSESPEELGRRRSVSTDRYDRRRSGSLDRSRSPEWRDRRRFVRRTSRSPPRRRSRSPGRERSGGVLNINRFRSAVRGPKLEEVKVTGSKVISIKKAKKEGEETEDGEREKQEKKEEDKTQVKDESRVASSKSGPVIEEEVKSLEDIYRERALLSLMEAKRKKILENKRKRWEKVETAKTSESEKSDKLEKKPDVDEKGDKPGDNKEVDSSSDSAGEDGDNSEIELPDDIDVEIGEGELESEPEPSDAGSHAEESNSHGEESPEKSEKEKTKSAISIPAKPNIKSRLGLKAKEQVSQQAVKDRLGNSPSRPHSVKDIRQRSVKDRLGIRSDRDTDKPSRGGVIRLGRNSKADDVMSRIRINRDLRGKDSKNVLMVPQITIKNQYDIEERKAGIKQRLGLLDDDENSNDSRKSRKKRKTIDEELMKLLREEEADVDEDDLELLSKREKKKLLKKLLVQQGREDEYEEITRKKKKKGTKRRERGDEEDDRGSRRRISVKERHDKRKEEEYEEEDLQEDEDKDLQSEEEEIHLEESTRPGEDSSPERTEDSELVVSEDGPAQEMTQEPVKSEAELKQEREEKEARLRAALEPKSLEDIRKERAMKRSQPSGDASIRISTGQNKRKIVLEGSKPERAPEPPVRVTFSGLDTGTQPKRKLIRLGGNREQDENDQPSEPKSVLRGVKRERQIYVPPTLKRSDEKKPADKTSRLGAPARGRDIIDYGDMFPKSAGSSPEKKATVRLTSSASESDLTVRPPLRLQKGPLKVEVKDATVKTFAEIMAEKKRKRQLAQQGKSFTPLPEEDTESTSNQGSQSSNKNDRLSPLQNESPVLEVPSSVSSSPIKFLKKSASTSIVQQTDKPARWKRRKLNESESASAKPQAGLLDSSEDSNSMPADQTNFKITETQKIKEENVFSDSAKAEVTKPKKSITSEDRQLSESTIESKQVPEARKKMLDSFLDFDDDLLNSDSDLELEAGHQDADELMKEIDELLS